MTTFNEKERIISTAEYAVSNQNTLVSAHSHCLTKNLFCLGKSHGNNGNLCSILVF